MATITFKGNAVHTNGTLPGVGTKAPAFTGGKERFIRIIIRRVERQDGPLRGLLARSVVVINEEGTVVYTELVPEITTEPDYEAALAVLQ